MQFFPLVCMFLPIILSGASNGSGLQTFLSSQYIIPIFLAMIVAASLVSSRTKIPHTMVLVGFGIAISFFGLAGLNIIDIKQLRVNPQLIINFIIPPFFTAITFAAVGHAPI